jgi:hypothetical protein
MRQLMSAKGRVKHAYCSGSVAHVAATHRANDETWNIAPAGDHLTVRELGTFRAQVARLIADCTCLGLVAAVAP